MMYVSLSGRPPVLGLRVGYYPVWMGYKHYRLECKKKKKVIFTPKF